MSIFNIFRRRSNKKQDTQEYGDTPSSYNELEPDRESRAITLSGVIEKPDHAKPKTFWEKIAEERVYPQLLEMGNTPDKIDAFQRKRVLKSVLLGLIMLFLAVFIHKWFYVAVPMAILLSYKMQVNKVDSYYRAWRFARQLNFSKFTRLVIPYLKASEGNMALYTIFNRMLSRLDTDADRASLYRLMGDMGDKPESIEPFLAFAERSSGTDMSHLFMSTIFDFQQTTFNTAVIDELGKIAADDMMKAIDEIIEVKIRRFVMFPTKMVMTSFILVVGLGAAILFHNIKDISLDGGGLTFIEEETAGDIDSPVVEPE